jgi:hypothetical protein
LIRRRNVNAIQRELDHISGAVVVAQMSGRFGDAKLTSVANQGNALSFNVGTASVSICIEAPNHTTLTIKTPLDADPILLVVADAEEAIYLIESALIIYGGR